MKAIQTEYYGDNTRWFIADVVDHTPPYGYEGRVKIRVHGVHNPSTREIPQNDLPWAQVVLPTTEGGVSGLGRTPRLASGATVFGFFMDGKASQVPLVVGSIPKIEYPTRVQRQVEFNTIQERIDQEEIFYEQEITLIDSQKVEDEEFGLVYGNTIESRKLESIKYFMNAGYSLNQSIGIVAGLLNKSNLSNTAVQEEDKYNPLGIAGWQNERQLLLKRFSGASDWRKFSSQLVFIKYELSSTQAAANIRLKRSKSLERDTKNSCQRVFAKYYLGMKKEIDFQSVDKLAVTLQNLVGT
jgi:hypothetical protein